MSELSEDIPVFREALYPERYYCPGDRGYYLAEDCENPNSRATCPKCGRAVRTRPRNKNVSTYERKYIDIPSSLILVLFVDAFVCGYMFGLQWFGLL